MQTLREEIQKFVKSPKTIIILMLGPLIFTLLFGAVYYNDYLNDIPVGVFDQDHSSTSRMIVKTFEDNDRFNVVVGIANKTEFEALLDSKKIHLGVFIPKDFEKNVKRGRTTGALLVVDGTNIAIGNNAVATASEILNTLNAGVTVKVMEGKNASVEEANKLARIFQFQSRTLYDPKLSYKYYVMPGLVMVLVQQLFLAVFVPNFIDDPVNPIRKGIVYTVAGTISYGICLLALHSASGIEYAGFPLIPVGLMWVYLMCLLGSALTLGALLRNRLLATQFCMMLSMPTFLLSGYVWPAEQVPIAVNMLIKLFWPLADAIVPVRDILIKGTSPAVYAGQFISLLVFGTVWLAIGLRLSKKRLGCNSCLSVITTIAERKAMPKTEIG